MPDLVNRLRMMSGIVEQFSTWAPGSPNPLVQVLREAADEIERLRMLEK